MLTLQMSRDAVGTVTSNVMVDEDNSPGLQFDRYIPPPS